MGKIFSGILIIFQTDKDNLPPKLTEFRTPMTKTSWKSRGCAPVPHYPIAGDANGGYVGSGLSD